MGPPRPKKTRSRADNGSAGVDPPSRPGESDSSVPKTAGQILRIELRNFMNHASLDLDLEPNKVNYITGRNGAGKSSVIQAAVLALGGNATATKRATNVKAFVRHGCNKAEIRVRLANVGEEEAYKPEVFGSAIVVERVIYISPQGQPQSHHFVRNAAGKVVYEKKKALEEKKAILRHFVIELDNPTTILQQEEAKVFFTDNSPKKRYEFFFKGTMLSVALTEYQEARKDHTISKFSLEDKDKYKGENEQEEERLGKVHDLLLKLSKHDNAEMFDAKKLIAKAKNEEAEAQRLSERIQRHIEKANRAETQLEEKEEELRALEKKFEEGMLQNRRTAERVEELTTERKRASEENKAATARLREQEQRLEDGKNQVPRLREQIKKLENAIRTERNKAGRSAQEREKKTAELQKKLIDLNKAQEEWKKKIEEGGNKRRELQDRRMELQAKRSEVRTEQSRKKAEKLGLAKSLKQLQQQMDHGRDLSRVFGVEFANLMADIERNSDKFSAPPVGPVGRHVKLVGQAARDQDLCDLIESDLGRGRLRTFIVNTMDDQEELLRIFGRHFHGRKPPNITKMSFLNRRVALGNGMRAASTQDFTVLMDYFQFDNDVAYNYFLTHTDMATTLVLSEEQAMHLFSDDSRVPAHARRAITTDFYSYRPNTANMNYGSNYIERNTGRNLLAASGQCEIDNLSSQMADADADIERLELEIERHNKLIAEAGYNERLAVDRVESDRKGFQGVNVEIQRCRAALEDLAEKDPTEEFQREVRKREEEVTKILETYAPLRIEIKKLKVAVEESERELSRREGELAAARPKNDSSQKLDLMKGEIQSKRKQLRQHESTKTILERELAQTRSKRDEKLGDAERHKREARERTNGGDIGEVRETEAELNAKEAKVRQARKKIVNEDLGGISMEEFQEKFRKLKAENAKLKIDMNACGSHVKTMEKGLSLRGIVFMDIRHMLGRRLGRDFNQRMADFGLFGKPEFDHDEKTLDLTIAHLDGGRVVGDFMPISNFSGGERSRTLACFIMSLWELNSSPFKALDELDVYLDEMNRSDVEEMLLKFASNNSGYQYIFISPQPPNNGLGVNVIKIK